MPPEEISVIVKWLERIEQALNKQREETREDINRIHERLDIQRDAVTRPECEKYRGKCCEITDKKIAAAKGVPYWVTGVVSLCVALITYVATN